MPPAPNPWRIGVDTGGTFTDLVLVDGDGTVRDTHKRLSTPDDPGRAVLEGIAHLLNQQAGDASADESAAPGAAVVHGSTVATNALLEGKGGPAALVTTTGFEDVLAIARQDRPDLYATVARRPDPPIPRAMAVGVDERTAYDGSVLTELTPREVDAVVQRLGSLDPPPAAIAICLLHSYANPVHEARLADAIRAALPGVHLTVSHGLLPEVREYERAATCAANAVVAPKMSWYLGKLDAALADSLGPGRLRIMASGGGTLPVDAVRERPVETITSGPAGGAIGAWAMAQSAGIECAIGFDMGGTSTDVTLIDGGPTHTTHTAIAGLPVKLPMVDIHTVGAGGGSIARLDAGGALRVGPESAGVDPGPACYGRQAGPPDPPVATVTDAHVVLGHLTDGRRLGDALAVDRAAAIRAVAHLAAQAKLSLEHTAEGILRIADAAVARAVQQISVQRGRDVRDFTLCAFGGAGGLHACRLADMLGMSRVLIPQHGGLLSALGMLAAPPRFQFSQAVVATLTPDAAGDYPDPLARPDVRAVADALHELGRVALTRDGVATIDQQLRLSLDLRFAGQSHELPIACTPGGDVTRAFLQTHERLFGYIPDGRPIEIVAARLEATGPIPALTLNVPASDTTGAGPLAERHVPVLHGGEAASWPRVPRPSLCPGTRCAGPLIVEEYAATTVIPPHWHMEVLPDGQFSITRSPAPRKAASSLGGTHAAPNVTSASGAPGGGGDPVELEVFRHLFASIAEEMGERLMRSAYSPNIKERRDYSCALFDAHGEMLAQAAHIPVHLGSTPMSVRAVLDAFDPAGMKSGDRFVLNDPYQGGTHLPDITVVEPVVLPGSVGPAFYVANRAHHADVGGIAPGSLPISGHIDDEGLRLPPQRLDDEAVAWIANASRTPDERRGDLLAQTAALRLGAARLAELSERYSLATVTQRGRQLQHYAERLMRSVIADLPDGRYLFEDVLDDDGQGNTDIAIRCALSIVGDIASLDFSASDDQTAGPVNAVRSIVVSAVDYCFRVIAPFDLPGNGGVMRPITVVTRPGSVVDAQHPSPVAGGNVETSQRLVDVVFGALAKAAPHRVPAASCGSMNNITLGGTDPRTGPRTGLPFAYYETIAGGAGGGPGVASGSGGSAVHTHMTNTLNTPAEAIEHAYPFRIERYALRDDAPPAAGQLPGGVGVVRRYRFDAPVQVTLLTERRTHAPYGLAGGAPGAAGVNTLIHPDGRREPLPAKCSLHLDPGSAIEIATPGGGGWGPPGTSKTPAL